MITTGMGDADGWQRIFEAYHQLVREGAVAPPVNEMRAVVETNRTAWQEHREWRPSLPDVEHQRLGEWVASW